ncbi:MAG: hypothetical protein JWR16_3288 [Nevskia sp.]|nr:hypothetical protein [Nevskia sp.]
MSEPNSTSHAASTADKGELASHPLPLRTPVDARGFSIGLLAVIASVFALKEAGEFFVPLLLGMFVAYTLNPIVFWLERRGIRRAVGTTLVMLVLVCGLGYLGNSLQGQAETIVEQLPRVTAKMSALVQGRHDDQPSVFQRVQAAAREVEKARRQAENSPSSKQGPTHVIVDNPNTSMSDLMWEGSRGLVGFVGQVAIVLFLVFFLLLSGDIFKRKLVRLTGPSLSAKKITVQILDDINISIQKYMLALFVTNTLLAVATWAAFTALGLENAGAWSVAAGLLHVIPYFGPLITAIATGMAAFLQTGSLPMALGVAGISILIAAIVGMLITTWMTGRITRMNAAAVFISLLFWTYLWGVCGALLAVPITGMIKVICQRIEQFHPVAELLGE